MKKIFLSLTLSAALLSSAFTYAANNEPNYKVKQAFTNEFTQVKNVEWIIMDKEGVYQAKFIFNNETLQAFFTEEGEFLGTTRQVLKSQLPISVASGLEKQYGGARVISIFEYSKKDGLDYYFTLTTDKGAMIVKATGNGEFSVYKKNIK
ncbi:MAG TPA: hypothetical protein VK645_01480 [Chitinophagaceae bacterium]|jgi:hypothetical protein|nr:hypothetical protein [Chitinophagaceae bacterium]